MRVMVTGAGGFLGRQLVQRLLESGSLRGRGIEALVLLDQRLDGFAEDHRLRLLEGSITDPTLLRRALADGMDVVFHLVSIPGGAAEREYGLGHQVNLLASLELLDQLRRAARPAVLVYASSVAVYGADLPKRMDEGLMPRPALSYGAHKLMVETQVSDLARRGEVDGRVLRLPGIVARPREPNGLRSAFMSDLMHALAAGEAYECPVSPSATAWWMSARCCVDNLLHAAGLDNPGAQPIWQLPVLQLSVAQVVEALAEAFGDNRRDLVSYRPDDSLEALFGRYPPLRTPLARTLGFRHDGSAQALVRNALNATSRRTHAIERTA
ncbi:NAD-dependent epimerase/dehydratase family protein [Pseudomonas sp. BN414]|uniref:NAD-dependent epimerase/dehydratase family protein n=1 Tax=Pseudomonas sp. BN414 TaxID=2567888 RepID=UPI0024587432|nr:NAD-dependent epimerase/dehydratase family protein [Pseudomonas sp. BN414]MDH4566589.1 NAD-dependent epimerase/dehydratase family protein [Pseudomonas sp. BN414]